MSYLLLKIDEIVLKSLESSLYYTVLLKLANLHIQDGRHWKHYNAVFAK